MKQYLDLLKEVLYTGQPKGPAREGMPPTREIFCRTMTFDLQEGFPLLTTKRMARKSIVSELIWFLRGDTNIKFLVDNGNPIWIDDCYKFYCRRGGSLPKDVWLNMVKDGMLEIIGNEPTGFRYGECGDIYGAQWRRSGGFFDQIYHVCEAIKNRPNERYHIIDAWDPATYLSTKTKAALPACHVFYQFCVRGEFLDMMMLQRSCDIFLGVPFDLAMCGLLCHLIALETGLKPGIFTWVGNSIHLYSNHLDQAIEQLARKPLPLCKVEINKKLSLYDYEIEDIKFVDYKCHPAIKAPLSVGV